MKIMQGWKHASRYRRGLAFMLAVVMTAVNILAGAGTAFAAEEPGEGLDDEPVEVVCRLDAETVKAAIESVMQGQNPADADPEEGEDAGKAQLYELDAAAFMEPHVAGAEVKLLYDADADEVVVRLINRSGSALAFRAQVGDDGYTTETVTVAGAPVTGKGMARWILRRDRTRVLRLLPIQTRRRRRTKRPGRMNRRT